MVPDNLTDPGSVLVICGPTAIGKTAVAMAVQDALGGREHAQLISADSALIYRGMDIGTAKPTQQEQQRYPHALIDIRDPSETYSAADGSGRCRDLVIAAKEADCCRRQYDVSQMPGRDRRSASTDIALRQDLERELAERSAQSLRTS